jgi:sugar/nucleoside kinase (ribokinase family)
LTSLYQTSDFDEAIRSVRGHCRVAAITRGPKGSVVVTEDAVQVVAADTSVRVVDTTGAGDLYAAGFLYGFTHGRDLATSALLGGVAAGEIISHVGARPERPLTQVAAEKLGSGFFAPSL